MGRWDAGGQDLGAGVEGQDEPRQGGEGLGQGQQGTWPPRILRAQGM